MSVSKKDVEFAKQFGNFVNGGMSRATTVAAQMAKDHRYCQSQMFDVCMEYLKVLAHNYRKGYYDGRNEYACQMAQEMLSKAQDGWYATERAVDWLDETNEAIYYEDFH